MKRAVAINGRRHARQRRSRATVQRILDSAAALIAEKGSELVTMTEIAVRADVVIGSLYQYFADKTEIHRALLARHYEDVRAMLAAHLEQVSSLDHFQAAIEELAEKYFALHQHDKFFHGIWSAVQTDATLQAMDVEDTLQNARLLYSICRPLLPAAHRDKLMTTCALLLQFALTAGRFGRVVTPAMRRHTIAIFRRMIRDSFTALIDNRA